ncbi:hypothetical protein [Pedobacter mucosus]|uniref:hypothetical protein n=1 Tax=Pedobacter mucosus TaxID=2895286 RepID=UPI001EE473C7|nr:hypothetical protein [Pedobacter mucosus]UKT65391.1 hypothetical protein LOK61_06305 [Pedobacter mucosus]
MFGSNTIEIALGLIVVFILLSIICTAIREGIEAFFKTRAAYLEQGIRELLNDFDGEGITKSLYEHPLISGLFNGSYQSTAKSQLQQNTVDKSGNASLVKNDFNRKSPDLLAKGNNLPSYIPSKNFARALMDLAVQGKDLNSSNQNSLSNVISIENIRNNIALLESPPVQRVLLNAIDMAQGNLLEAEANIENWYNSSMDRVSGWYKRSTQWVIFWIGLSVAVALNINVLTIIDYLSKNDTARKVIVEQAGQFAKNSTATNMSYIDAQTQLKGLNLPIGWSNENAVGDGIWYNFFGPVLGWLIAGVAATLGAPYWFDVLNKVMVIRSTVKPHEKSGEEASQDTKEKKNEVVVMQPAQIAPVQQAESIDHEHRDACDIDFDEETPDTDLPVSKGGLAL